MLRPLLVGAVQEQNHAGQNVAAEDAPVTVDEQVSAAKGFLQEDHVQIDGLSCTALRRSRSVHIEERHRD